jgi:hypothetical protein
MWLERRNMSLPRARAGSWVGAMLRGGFRFNVGVSHLAETVQPPNTRSFCLVQCFLGAVHSEFRRTLLTSTGVQANNQHSYL